MDNSQPSKQNLILKFLLWVVPGIICLVVLFFLPAGTLKYWQAWVFLSILILPTLGVCFYLLKKNPELLNRRMKTRERDPKQRLIIGLSGILLTPVFLLPGFDRRWGWSHVPVWLVILADVFAVLAYLFYFLVIRENSYAARVIEVEQGQKVTQTGPYAVVRHPMYVAMIVMYLCVPLALGSFWALIPALMIIPVIVLRIINEEKMLVRDLPGYDEYRRKVKYRLIPGVW